MNGDEMILKYKEINNLIFQKNVSDEEILEKYKELNEYIETNFTEFLFFIFYNQILLENLLQSCRKFDLIWKIVTCRKKSEEMFMWLLNYVLKKSNKYEKYKKIITNILLEKHLIPELANIVIQFLN
jgi:hypothetical protein